MKTYVYCLLNKENQPFYIGKTKNSLEQRKKQHQRNFKKETYILLLEECKENEWKFWEMFWIEQFKNWGFILKNKNKGGGGPSHHPHHVRIKMSNTLRPTTSQKLKGTKRPDVSKRRKGSKLSKETCLKISKAKLGKSYNKERSIKIKKSNTIHYKQGSNRNNKISEKLKGRKYPNINRKRKIVIQMDKNNNIVKEFPSISKAASSINKPVSAISECCNNKRKSAYGYKWVFKIKNYVQN